MRTLIVLVLTLSLIACATTTRPVSISEGEKINQAEQLVRFSLTDRLLASLQQRSIDQIGRLLEAREVPIELADRLLNEELKNVTAAEMQRLLDALVPIYRRYYTPDEIHQLLSFYQTDVARKSLKVSEQIAAEGQKYVRQWNDHFSEELLKRIDERLRAEGLSIAP